MEVLHRVMEQGYPGGKSALYGLVAELRSPAESPMVRFEGLPGEFSQHDFGHVDVRFAAWADVLHDADLSEAIIDRGLARGRLLELRGPSYRTRHIKSPPLDHPEAPARVSGKDRPEFPEPTSPAAVGIETS